MFWRKEQAVMPRVDVQSAAIEAIIKGAAILPSRRLTSTIYYTLLEHRSISVADLDDLANRLSRLAWERGRK